MEVQTRSGHKKTQRKIRCRFTLSFSVKDRCQSGKAFEVCEFAMVEVAVSRALFREIPERISRLTFAAVTPGAG